MHAVRRASLGMRSVNECVVCDGLCISIMRYPSSSSAPARLPQAVCNSASATAKPKRNQIQRVRKNEPRDVFVGYLHWSRVGMGFMCMEMAYMC